MNYGYNCTLCGDPIKEPQATEHTDLGLAHLTCVNRLILSKNTNDPKATASALAAKWAAAAGEWRKQSRDSAGSYAQQTHAITQMLEQCRRELLEAFGIKDK